jgi:hypothetical protein
MASPSEQRKRIDDARDYGQTVFERELGSWTDTTVGEWAAGTSRIPPETEAELDVILRRTYQKIARRFLRVDYRVYKQDEEERDPFDETMAVIAGALAALFGERIGAASASILNTLRTMMTRATEAANEEPDLTPEERNRVARRDLRGRMREHRLIIAVTESNWTVNKTHKTAILAVRDPLGNSVERIAQLFEEGDSAGARRLARRALKLARLPSSVRQGELLNTVSDFRDRLVTPEAQARMVATMRSQARNLGQQTKRWEAIFRNTRPAHAAAHGQTKPADEPFEVGGYLMQEPMDGSLGAPLGQIINCQCRAVWE